MFKDQKIICAKAGLLELAKQLGNVSQDMQDHGLQPPQCVEMHSSKPKIGRPLVGGHRSFPGDICRAGIRPKPSFMSSFLRQ